MYNKYTATAVDMIININGGELQTIRLGLIVEDSFVVFAELFRSYYIALFEEENVFPMQYVSFEHALSLHTVFYDPTGSNVVYGIERFCEIKNPILKICEAGIDKNYDSQYTERLKMSPLKELIDAAILNAQNISDAKNVAEKISKLPNDMFDSATTGLVKSLANFSTGESKWDRLVNIRCMHIIMNAFENKLKETN